MVVVVVCSLFLSPQETGVTTCAPAEWLSEPMLPWLNKRLIRIGGCRFRMLRLLLSASCWFKLMTNELITPTCTAQPALGACCYTAADFFSCCQCLLLEPKHLIQEFRQVYSALLATKHCSPNRRILMAQSRVEFCKADSLVSTFLVINLPARGKGGVSE